MTLNSWKKNQDNIINDLGSSNLLLHIPVMAQILMTSITLWQNLAYGHWLIFTLTIAKVNIDQWPCAKFCNSAKLLYDVANLRAELDVKTFHHLLQLFLDGGPQTGTRRKSQEGRGSASSGAHTLSISCTKSVISCKASNFFSHVRLQGSIFSPYCDSFWHKLSQYGKKILYTYVYHIVY